MLQILSAMFWGFVYLGLAFLAFRFVRMLVRDMLSQPCPIVMGFRGFIAEGGLRDLLMALAAILAVTLILAPFLPH